MSAIPKSTAESPIEPIAEPAPAMSIAKPASSRLDKFKSKRASGVGAVETLPTALPHHRISDARDFVMLHPDPEYWSDEFCFVSIPVEGSKPLLHLIMDDLAEQLPAAMVKRCRLALGAVATGHFFLCEVPSQNLDNSFNKTNKAACEHAKTRWVQVVREEGADRYTTRFAADPDAFPQPKWPTKSLAELVEITFEGRMIEAESDPAWRRLIGAKLLP